MKKKDLLDDLKFLMKREEKFPAGIHAETKELISILEKGDDNSDFITSFSENLLNLVLENKINPYLREVVKNEISLINCLNINERTARNINATELIIKQDQAIREAAEGLQKLTAKISEFEKKVPESYKLSREYFEN